MKPNKILRCVAAILGAFWGLGVAYSVNALFIIRVSAGLSPLFWAHPSLWLILGLISVVFLIGVYGALHLLYRIHSGWLARWGTVGLASGFLVVPLLLAGAFSCRINPYIPPPDRELLAQFDTREKEFNEIVDLAQADKDLDCTAWDWSSTPPPTHLGLPSKRAEVYWKRLHNADIPHGLTTGPSWSEGISLNAWYIPMHAPFIGDEEDTRYTRYTKGFVYLSRPPRQTLTSLDTRTYEPRTYDLKIAYRPIRGNWYLFYEYDSLP